jgi:hypothetical protein
MTNIQLCRACRLTPSAQSRSSENQVQMEQTLCQRKMQGTLCLPTWPQWPLPGPGPALQPQHWPTQ